MSGQRRKSHDGKPARKPIQRLLIANRSEIACRIIRTARDMGIETVAVYSEPDRPAAHVSLADQAVALGGDSPATSYLSIERVIDAARKSGADAVHPGYGFLAENSGFAAACTAAGLTFVGPAPGAIDAMGDKIRARELARDCKLPLVPAAELTGDAKPDAKAASALGYPVLVKAAAGGGGRGMRIVETADALEDAVAAARREAASAFGDDRVFLEKYLSEPHHIEIQIFGDGNGGVVHLGERECSVQRRHQKIIEEAPSPMVGPALRDRMGEAAIRLAGSMDYAGAGTVEFIVDGSGDFYFLEMNTRLQVEHAVTEMITSTDLVRWQLEVASGSGLPIGVGHTPAGSGHAIECRIYAEDPSAGFLPTAGRVERVEHPAGPGIRVDSALYDGFDVPLEYDPMLAKIVAWAPDRAQAIERMRGALRETAILGVGTNVAFLLDILADPSFRDGTFTTTTVGERYADWRPDPSGLSIAAAAAAILCAAAVPPGGDRAARGTAASITDPWQTLAGWRHGRRAEPAERGDEE